MSSAAVTFLIRDSGLSSTAETLSIEVVSLDVSSALAAFLICVSGLLSTGVRD